MGLPANGGERVLDNRASAICTGTSDEVDQLAPANRRIVTVFGRLVENGQQTIVKAHWLVVSLGRTFLLLYASIYKSLTI